jgi:hypothetical protein
VDPRRYYIPKATLSRTLVLSLPPSLPASQPPSPSSDQAIKPSSHLAVYPVHPVHPFPPSLPLTAAQPRHNVPLAWPITAFLALSRPISPYLALSRVHVKPRWLTLPDFHVQLVAAVWSWNALGTRMPAIPAGESSWVRHPWA